MNTEVIDAARKNTAEDMICILAGMCDGAHQTDGAGFSKLDTNFGHSLASHVANGKSWTEKQANAALSLISKYHRQLGGKEFIDQWIKSPVFKYPPNTNTPVDKAKTDRILSSQDKPAVFKFNYDMAIVTAIKSIKGEHRDKKFWAAWDQTSKTWTVPVNETSIGMIMDVAEKFEFQIEERFISYLEKVQEKTAESRTMLSLNDNRNIVLAGDIIMISVTDASILEEFERELNY